MSSSDFPAPGTDFEMSLGDLAMNQFCPVSSIGELNAIMEGTTEEWFDATIRAAPEHMQEWLAQAPATASVLADFIKLALMLIPQSPDNSPASRMALDGTAYTGDKQARQWLFVNTEALDGNEYMLVAFLQPVLSAWHPYVQLPTVSLGVAKELAMLLYRTTKEWEREASRIRCSNYQPDDVPDPRVPDADDVLQDSDTGSDFDG